MTSLSAGTPEAVRRQGFDTRKGDESIVKCAKPRSLTLGRSLKSDKCRRLPRPRPTFPLRGPLPPAAGGAIRTHPARSSPPSRSGRARFPSTGSIILIRTGNGVATPEAVRRQGSDTRKGDELLEKRAQLSSLTLGRSLEPDRCRRRPTPATSRHPSRNREGKDFAELRPFHVLTQLPLCS